MPKYEYMLLRWHKPDEWWALDPTGEKTQQLRVGPQSLTLTQVLGEYGGEGWEVVNFTYQEDRPAHTRWPDGRREFVLKRHIEKLITGELKT